MNLRLENERRRERGCLGSDGLLELAALISLTAAFDAPYIFFRLKSEHHVVYIRPVSVYDGAIVQTHYLMIPS